MAINFTDVVNQLTSDAFATLTAARNGLAASRDLYHFQMAIHEFGEERVVQECASVLKERYRCSYAEAAAEAAHRVKGFLELSAGENTFRQVRENLQR
ncbi:hypothetical protein TZM84_004509 [Salmonella enterica subsp. enterica serovar Orion]|jgi:hypothetical protein|nr:MULTISPECIES: hypothetical protein [Enterobacteriaceae]EAA3364087.1 hypothetical protein [Salmonella enterica]EAN1390958.1 hypothetical protein [Salmonella enterica subsp. enterica serovar Liverpool]EBS0352726.1 hypothetical protein [Salmonella enterica subsp. enterica serovar Java]ECM9543492.1 hypothetical protein [Salmonella enterica subsp. enterica serovar Enteritidis]ECU7903409.1 hypothetical protein [Salmonella enterica subsp. enterica serovar Cerro]EDI6217383.1 hypothetical protein [